MKRTAKQERYLSAIGAADAAMRAYIAYDDAETFADQHSLFLREGVVVAMAREREARADLCRGPA